MKTKNAFHGRILAAMFTAYVLAIAFPGPARAELADLADVPLANSPSDAVLPNLMYILDDSGSMQWDYMPDNIQRTTSGSNLNNCKSCGGTTCTINARQCALGNPGSSDNNTADWGEPPYYSAQFNQIYYNPDITYVPGADYLGVSLGNSTPTAAKADGYTDPTTKDLTTTYPDVYYCIASASATFTGTIAGTVLTVTGGVTGTILVGMTLTSSGSISSGTKITALGTGTGGTGTYTVSISQTRASATLTGAWNTPTTAQLSDTALCKRNGINNVQASPNDYFMYYSNNVTAGTPLGAYPVATGTVSTSFNTQQVSYTGAPYYFTISPEEHCKDRNLVECTLSATPTGLFTFPAPVRYCSNSTNASNALAVSDTAGTASPKCRQKFDISTHRFPRYGRFRRVDIIPSVPSYPKSTSARRTDCASASTCTYAEELQNFANWYTYYRTRMALMKTATGRAFLPIDDRYRVGFITINPSSSGTVVRSTSPNYNGRYLAINKFDATQKSAWYKTLYNTGSNGSTPLREALSRVGRHYAGVTSGINSGMSEDPIQYSCQQNFALLTTDGYYNDAASDTATPGGATVGNQDNVATSGLPVYVSRATGTIDATGTTTVATPANFIAQQICTGNNTTSFSGGTQQACGCTGSQKRIKQRTQTGSNNAIFVDGIQTGTSTTVSATSFTDITACTLPLIVTTDTVVTETAQTVCSGGGNTTFNPAGDGQNQQTSCGCSSGRTALKQRVESYCTRVVTTDGVVTSTTYLGPSCSGSPTRSFTTPIACSNTGKSIAISPNPTLSAGTPSASNNGGTTLSIASFTPNPQTVITGSATTDSSGAGTANTLADVAMYYYKNDLRTSGSATIITNNVPTNSKDVAPHQHMATFTLGLGLQGVMDYIADYETNGSGDFANIKAGTFGACPWMGSGEQCNWPIPTAGTNTTLDDLWHAAVNGRGTYYSASDPNSLADGLAGALSALHIQTAAASASATSSPNITQTDNFIFSSTFRTVKWDGEIVAQQIDTTTGNVLSPIIWSAQAQVDTATGASADTRNIYVFDENAANKRKSFTFANLTSISTGGIAAEQPYFSGKCSALSQCSLLTSLPAGSSQQDVANSGTALVNYLRGWRENETSGVFRLRDHVLGDPINATPAFVRSPTFGFTDAVTPTYDDFKSANVGRTPTLYIAANDGMLHAFNGNTGVELWAYIPRIVLPNLHKLATDNWDVQHKFSVDGSPQIMDVYDSSATAWKTILVAGLNKGGRGFYAIDVTDPSTPKGMWEFCHDSTLCANFDSDMGFSYGNPVITKRASDGRWVVIVTSGLNNTSPGTGRGYLYVLDAFTGAQLDKVEAIDGATAWGDTTTPSGFSKISAFANNFNADNTALFVYGGDLFGNVWRFDMSVSPPAVQKLVQFTDSTGKPQSITSRPELGAISGNRVLFIGTGRYHGTSDLPDPSTLAPPLSWAYQQTLYAIKDKGTNYGNNIRAASPGLVQQTMTDTAGVRTISSNAVDWNTKDGWYVDFNPSNASPGERVNLDPQLVLGTLVVVTNVPNNSACTVGGDSFLYQFDYKSGSNVSTSAGGVVGQANLGQITVGVVIVRLPSGVVKAISTGATGTKSTFGVNIGSSGSGARRVSWRELFQW